MNRFFLPPIEKRCKESVYLEVIMPYDNIIAFGTDKHYICFNMDELIDIFQNNPAITTIYSLEDIIILKDILNSMTDNKKDLLITLINNTIEKYPEIVLLRKINENPNIKEMIVNTLRAIIDAAEVSTLLASRDILVNKYEHALNLLTTIPTEYSRLLIARGHHEYIRYIVSKVIVGEYDLNTAKNVLSESGRYYYDLIVKNETNQLKEELTNDYLSLEKGTPQINLQHRSKSAIPKNLLLKMVYEKPYREYCLNIDRELPPIQLIALANILKLDHNINITWVQLCNRIKRALYLLL